MIDDDLMKLVTPGGIDCRIDILTSDYDDIKIHLSQYDKWTQVVDSTYRVFQCDNKYLYENGEQGIKNVRRIRGSVGGRRCCVHFHSDNHDTLPPVLKTEYAFLVKVKSFHIHHWKFSLESWFPFPSKTTIPIRYSLSIQCTSKPYIEKKTRGHIIKSMKIKIHQCLPETDINWEGRLSDIILIYT